MRYRFIPTRGATHKSRFSFHDTDEEALEAAFQMHVDIGIPVLVSQQDEDGGAYRDAGTVPSLKERRAEERRLKEAKAA